MKQKACIANFLNGKKTKTLVFTDKKEPEDEKKPV